MKKIFEEMLSPEKIDEAVKYVEERFEETEKIKNEIRSSTEYICWIRDILEVNGHVNDYDIEYKEDRLEKKTFENMCKLSYFYSIIEEYWEKYHISPTYIEEGIGASVYRVFYEDFYFEVCKVPYLQGYISVRKIEDRKNAINYKDIMKDKEPKEYKEKQKFIKEFQEQIKKSKEKAEELDIDIKYLKEIVEDEFK